MTFIKFLLLSFQLGLLSTTIRCSHFILLYSTPTIRLFLYIPTLLDHATVTFYSVTCMSIRFYFKSTIKCIGGNYQSFCWNFSCHLLIAIYPQVVSSRRTNMNKSWVFAYRKPFVIALFLKDCLTGHEIIDSNFL